MSLLSTLRRYIFENDGYSPYPMSFFWDNKARFNDYVTDEERFNVVLQNPAMLKVITLQCDLFSLGRIKVFKKSGKEDPEDPALERLNNPNPMQGRSQFLWDFMFWLMIGNAYCYVDSDVPENEEMKMYMLEHGKMIWPREMDIRKDKLIFSEKSLTEIGKQIVEYRYEDGSKIQIPVNKLVCMADLTNGAGNWFKGPSRIKALYKFINNSEAILDSTKINYDYVGKFLVAGQQDPKDVSKLPMSPEEKQDIETKMNGRKKVHAVKSMIEINRFVSDLRNLELPQQYLAQYFAIGNMYNIPRDVLEAYVSATYENQEKARASHVSYTLQPKGNDFMDMLAKRWGYTQKGKRIEIGWEHLPFMQVFEKDNAETKKKKMETLTAMLKLNISIDEANEFLGTKFTTANYEQPAPKQPATGNRKAADEGGE